jgi:hypothetical protein
MNGAGWAAVFIGLCAWAWLTVKYNRDELLPEKDTSYQEYFDAQILNKENSQ